MHFSVTQILHARVYVNMGVWAVANTGMVLIIAMTLRVDSYTCFHMQSQVWDYH
jgi:hypothetical protein